MAIAYVANASSINGSTSSSVNTTGANFLVCCANQWIGGGTNVVSDSYSNTWTQVLIESYGQVTGALWYVANATTGTGHTFSCTAGYGASWFMAFSGVATTSVLDQSTYGTGVSSALQPGSITPTNNGSLLITGYASQAGTGSCDSGFTYYATPSGGANFTGCGAYLIQTTSAAVNPTWTGSGGVGEIATMASFNPGAGSSFTWLDMGAGQRDYLFGRPEVVGY